MRAACAVPGRVVSVDSRTKGNKMRRMTSVVVAITALCLVGSGKRAEADTLAVTVGPLLHPSNEHVYLLTGNTQWPNAEALAVQYGGHLATIRSASENQWLVETFTPLTDKVGAWMGLNDIEREGSWVWSSGDAVTYTNWGPGEPSLAFEDWGELLFRDQGPTGPGDWNNEGDWPNVRLPGIIELASMPQAPAISRRLVRQDCSSLDCLAFDVGGFFASDGFTIDPLDPVINGTNISLDIFAYSPGGTPDEVITPFNATACFGPLADGLYRDTINLYVDGELVDTLTGSFNVPIPEPATVAMLVMTGAMMARRRR